MSSAAHDPLVCDYCQSPLPDRLVGASGGPGRWRLQGLLLPGLPDGRRDRRGERRAGRSPRTADPARPVDLLLDERHGLHDGPLDDGRLRGRRSVEPADAPDARPLPLRGPALLLARAVSPRPSALHRHLGQPAEGNPLDRRPALAGRRGVVRGVVPVGPSGQRSDLLRGRLRDPRDDDARSVAGGDGAAEGDLGARRPREVAARHRPPGRAGGGTRRSRWSLPRGATCCGSGRASGFPPTAGWRRIRPWSTSRCSRGRAGRSSRSPVRGSWGARSTWTASSWSRSARSVPKGRSPASSRWSSRRGRRRAAISGWWTGSPPGSSRSWRRSP